MKNESFYDIISTNQVKYKRFWSKEGEKLAGVLGIIAEYNPFHNGHLYHLEESKQKSDCQYSICVMTGNFAQRGGTSLVNKWTKAEMALNCGVDLILELPTIYSVSSAENFAEGAVKILNSTGLVTNLSFGMEANDVSTLNNIANVLYQEPKEYITMLNHELSKGISYPKARENALMMYLNDIKRYANILSGANNILAIEYLKALKRTKSYMMPLGIQRKKVFYHEEKIVDEFASATAIRKLVQFEQFDEIRKVMPRAAYQLLREEMKRGNIVLDLGKYESIILYNLRKMSEKKIAEIPDVAEGLEYSIKEAASSCNNIRDLVNMVKSKRHTQTRIQRILVYALLGIDRKTMEMSRKMTPYLRVLGFNDKGKELLSEIVRRNPKIQLITSVKKFMDTNPNKQTRRMLEIDLFATDTYTLGYEYESKANLDYTNKLIVI